MEKKRKEQKHGKTEEEAVEEAAVARNLETEDKAEMLETGLTYCLADVSSILAYPSPQRATRMGLKTYVSSTILYLKLILTFPFFSYLFLCLYTYWIFLLYI